MAKKGIIARNLLLEHCCKGCVYLGKVHELCILRGWPNSTNNYVDTGLGKLPDEKTCSSWELRNEN